MAIRRFNFSYERRLPEDKLIDYITAFEALYLKGAREELGYRLALRCAYFLGKDEEERKRIFEILKGAYDVRSKIVHGGQIQSKSLNKIINKFKSKISCRTLYESRRISKRIDKNVFRLLTIKIT